MMQICRLYDRNIKFLQHSLPLFYTIDKIEAILKEGKKYKWKIILKN